VHSLKGPFIVSPWFVAYLIQYRLLRLKVIKMDEQAVKLQDGKDLEDARDADGVVGSIDALSHMLGFEEDEPGLSLCQGRDLELDIVNVDFRADRISDLDWVLALRSMICHVKLVGSVPKITSGESGARFPRSQRIAIQAPPMEKSVEEESLEEWTPLLSHIIDSCPKLLSLTVSFEPSPEDFRFSYIDVVAKFRDSVFPRLPQETKTRVRVRLWVAMEALEYEALIREHGDEINRTFDKQGDAERDKYFAQVNTLLFREVQWEMGSGQHPWGVGLVIRRPDDDAAAADDDDDADDDADDDDADDDDADDDDADDDD